MAFTHLHVHTEYSLLDGSNKIKECVERVKELGMNSCAITDHGVMYGVIDFYKAARAEGINPILGCEVYVAPNSRFDKEVGGGEERYHHLVLLAENNQGYANLTKIVSRGFTEGYYYKPRVDFEVLQEFHEGIIALSACLAGEVPRYIEKGLIDEAKKCALKYEACFGKGNYFLELQDHGIPQQQTVNAALLSMSKELDIPLVATNDVHYTKAEDAQAHDILLCIQTGKHVDDEDRMRYDGGQYYIKSEEEMKALFPYALQALENTQKIADRCHVEIEFGVTKLPKFEVPEGYDSWTYLNKLCFDGLKERYPDNYEMMKERLDFELGTIKRMGYVDYFLIVWDFINYAKENDIPVGPGRGSAAGAIVSYCLKITDIDPIRYNLFFERFLSTSRVSLPDVDVDFCPRRRQDIIEYVRQKYGPDKVVQIVTFGTMGAKGVIRDVARAMDIPYNFADSISKMVPNELNMTLDKALEMSVELKNLYDENEQVHELIDMCKKLEGLPRNSSMHAAGVVICQKPADEFVPLSRGSDGAICTQFAKETVEELGLLKMDFLGLRNLTVIKDTVDLIKDSQGIEIDINHIDYNDKKVYDFIGTGKTDGVFQLESGGMKNFMKELRPESLEDVIAGISLYRPGPMDFIPRYIAGKNNPDKITYETPLLEPILEPTYGCIVYQEQVMQIVRELGGYTLGRSDEVRRAMSKKKQYVMEKERNNFIYGNEEEGVPGCLANGISEEVASHVYDEMMDFAKYAFNKSHAACYAVVAYQTAYLKYYYPVEFMAALMTSVIDNSTKVTEYIVTCRNMGIKILPPDVNYGQANFSVQDGAIRFALTALKNIGWPVIQAIVEERQKNGLYKSLKDFIDRTVAYDINKRVIENLIKAGAFDTVPGNRRQLLTVYSDILEQQVKNKKTGFAGQMSLFDLVSDEEKEAMEIRMPNLEEYDKEELLALEKEVVGFYVSGHPLEEYMEFIQRRTKTKTTDFYLDEETDLTGVQADQEYLIAGIISSKRIKYTKNNKTMAFIMVEDMYGSTEVVFFPRDYEKNYEKLVEDSKVFIRGRAQVEDQRDGKLIGSQVTPFDEMPRRLVITFKDKETYLSMHPKMMELLADSEGKDSVAVVCTAERIQKILPPNQNVAVTEELLEKLRAQFGVDAIRVL